MAKLTFTILGCGSSGGVPRLGGIWGDCDPENPRNRRRRCSLLITRETAEGATRVLIDTSPDMREQLLDAGVGALDGVVYTHSHADHMHGIDDLRQVVFNQRQRLPVWADGPGLPRQPEEFAQFAPPALEPLVFETEGLLPQTAALYDRLAIARESADALGFSEQRSRATLYAALGQAYDFALATAQDPQSYAEILEDAGLKAQDRAPMTPIVKLVFGATYDKTRLAEYAAVLSYALRQALPVGKLPTFIEGFDGGLKGMVQTERLVRRPAARPGKSAAIETRLASAPRIATLVLDGVDSQFVSMIARREADGSFAVVSLTEADAAQLARAAKQLK